MDYEELRNKRNTMNPFANNIGVHIEEIREGYARSTLKVDAPLLNMIGSIHGGCLYTIADATCGSAAGSYGNKVTTVDSSFHFLRAGLDATMIICEANVIKAGKRLIVIEAKITDQNAILLSEGIFTFAVI